MKRSAKVILILFVTVFLLMPLDPPAKVRYSPLLDFQDGQVYTFSSDDYVKYGKSIQFIDGRVYSITYPKAIIGDVDLYYEDGTFLVMPKLNYYKCYFTEIWRRLKL